MRLTIFIAAAAAAVALAAPAQGASPPSGLTKHDQQVIRFFTNHPAQALTPAGQRALWSILGRVSTQVRTLQAARLAVPTTWRDAVNTVGSYFGQGTAAWEWQCSGSEGGHGAWVANYGGSGAGGWLQFLNGTFYGIIDRAIASGRARGMYVPDSARSWYSPLGQALAGAQMLADGRRGEWYGWTC